MSVASQACALLLAAAAVASAQDPPRGTVVEKVVCRGTPAQSYALYLPASYSPSRTWPILYALDPGARGRLPVERFKGAAEALGFIVAGSNNSRNGPMQASQEAVAAMLSDTVARFALDERRVYVTGFSGGARVAVRVAAALQGGAAGVIGFGAGFPADMQPSSSLRFAYFSAAGTDDFNYPELLALDRATEAARMPHRFLVFDGGHDWPPASVCARALEWMELQAMRTAIRPRDTVLAERLLAAGIADASSEEQAGHPNLAAMRYAALAQDFSGLLDVSSCEKKMRDLSQSREAKEAEAELKKSVGRQEGLSTRVHALVIEALAGDDRFAATHDLAAAIHGIRKEADTGRQPSARMAARRVLTWAWIWLSESADADVARGAFEQAATRLRAMTEVRPDNSRVEVRLARACARAGSRKEAMAALQRAVAKGFTEADVLEKEEDFATLRSDQSFRTLVGRLKNTR